MTQQTIAIDIDDVLAASAQGFADYSNERWGLSLAAQDYDEDYAKPWGITREEAIKRAEEYHASGIFSGIHFVGMWDSNNVNDALKMTKTEVCRQIGADYLVDDQIKHCVSAAEAGIQTLLFGDYAWNKLDTIPANLTKVKDWQEVKAYFDKLPSPI